MPYLHQIDPVAVALGPLKIHWYGLMYLLAFAAFWWIGSRRIRAGRLPGVNLDGFGDLMFYGMLGVVLGGRIGYVLFYSFSDFLANPLMIIRVWEGGMSFHGGLLGVLIACAWWARKRGLNFIDLMDFVAPLVPPGLGFGRLGNFIGGELWGKPTDAGWGVVFPKALPEPFASMDAVTLQQQYQLHALDALARHPSQLYQAGLEGLVMGAILLWHSLVPRPRYRMVGLFALLYGLFRFLIEFVRVPDAQIGTNGYLAFGWLTMGQVLSTPLIALGLYWLWKSRSAPTVHPQPAAS